MYKTSLPFPPFFLSSPPISEQPIKNSLVKIAQPSPPSLLNPKSYVLIRTQLAFGNQMNEFTFPLLF